jgi:hypothetical protein
MTMDALVLLVVDLVIVFTLLEWVGLRWYHQKTGRGVAPADISLNLLSGLALMGALRLALSGVELFWVLGLLVAAGLFHGWDIVKRWRR